MEIRTAGMPDIEAIRNIWNPVIRDTLITFTTAQKSPAELRQMIVEKPAQGYPFLVALQAGTVTGFATYGRFRDGPGYDRTMEHSIMLAPNAQGKGVGRALLTAIEKHAHGQGIHSLIAGISGENPAAVAFHLRCGFHKIAVVPQVGHKFGSWLDLILMQKYL
ncbi:MAG: GNAT family N-acetyltransferase [Rhodobacteraceae bacterium]|nr:GNAT family N-acetyltransferase [Paracoccaceae bacterium]